MTTTFHHLMIIEDGQSVENSLHASSHARALHLISIVERDQIGEGSLSEAVEEELDGDETPSDPEEYAQVICEVLSSNDFDVHFDVLQAPGAEAGVEDA